MWKRYWQVLVVLDEGKVLLINLWYSQGGEAVQLDASNIRQGQAVSARCGSLQCFKSFNTPMF
jgi:hypothetical protein